MTQLETICNQLADAIDLPVGLKVAALIEDDGTLKGWCIVRQMPYGQITPIDDKQYPTIADLLTLKEVYHKMMMEAIRKADHEKV